MATIVDSLIIQLGLDPTDMKNKLKDVEKTAETTDKKFETLGSKWVSGIQGIVTRLVAPITGVLAVSKMITSYTSSIAEVARMTGAYSDKLEQWRYKRAMLSRITKEDIDLYKKCREGVVKFNIALADLSAKIAREFSPLVKIGVEWLNKISNWVDRNGHNIVRFLQITAGVLSAVFLPTLLKMTAALWANPITWLVAALAGLALVIDDLVVYMQGGESALSDFWALFGTGAELSKKLGCVIEWLTRHFKKIMPVIAGIIGAVAGFKTLAAAGTMLASSFRALFTLLRFNPFALLITAAWLLYENWDEVCEGAKILFEELCKAFGLETKDVVNYVGEIIKGGKMLYGDTSDLLGQMKQGFLDLMETATDAWDAIVEALGNAKDAIVSTWDEIKSAVGGFFDAIAEKAEKLSDPLRLLAELFDIEENGGGTTPETSENIDLWKQARDVLIPQANNARTPAPRPGQSMNDILRGLLEAKIPAVGNVSANNTNVVHDNRSTTVNNSPVINVNGTSDPMGTAKIVFREAGRSALALPADSGIQM